MLTRVYCHSLVEGMSRIELLVVECIEGIDHTSAPGNWIGETSQLGADFVTSGTKILIGADQSTHPLLSCTPSTHVILTPVTLTL